jgi:cyclopropane fatty-acyl-phospholipid synthase-like methyltransferase
LDYGAGKGFLLQKFANSSNFQFSAAEFGSDALILLENKFGSYNNYLGTIDLGNQDLSHEAKKFDIITLIEVIEHLTDEFFEDTFFKINTLLSDNGKLIITTPFDENLTKKEVFCPDCGCVFHRVQHVRLFNVKSIADAMRNFGFDVLISEAIDFNYYKKRSFVKQMAYKFKSLILPKRKPHFVCVVQKKEFNS